MTGDIRKPKVSRFFVAFSDSEQRGWWTVFTTRGFKHCFAFTELDGKTLEINQLRGSTKFILKDVKPFDYAIDLVDNQEHKVLMIDCIPNIYYVFRGPLYCVSLVKSVLGIGGFSITPYQLYKSLKKQQDIVCVEVNRG